MEELRFNGVSCFPQSQHCRSDHSPVLGADVVKGVLGGALHCWGRE